MKNLDLTKPVRTKDKRKARIIATDAKNPHYSVIALVEDGHGFENPYSFTLSGQVQALSAPGTVNPLDLENVPERTTLAVWLNVYPPDYPGGSVIGHPTKVLADARSCVGRLACVPANITFTEAEGL